MLIDLLTRRFLSRIEPIRASPLQINILQPWKADILAQRAYFTAKCRPKRCKCWKRYHSQGLVSVSWIFRPRYDSTFTTCSLSERSQLISPRIEPEPSQTFYLPLAGRASSTPTDRYIMKPSRSSTSSTPSSWAMGSLFLRRNPMLMLLEHLLHLYRSLS